MIDKLFQELLDFAKTTDLEELVWQKNGRKIAIRRQPQSAFPHRNVVTHPSEKAPAPPVAPPVIRSLMVGTFYRSESPDHPPLVVEGTRVTAGQPVAMIEAMKIMKDVLAPQNGRIVKALVQNGHPVEYGQPLFEFEPENET